MNDGVFAAGEGLEGLPDDMLPALGQDLYRHIVGNEVLFDQGPQEGIFRLGGGGEAHLDLLKAKLYQ